MQIVLDPLAHNGRHDKWMRRTSGSYEWWYVDVVSDDGDWCFVLIFLLGNPFSPYYRMCALGTAADPISHNGVFAALYRRSQLHHYLFVNYPSALVTSETDTGLAMNFGPNRITYDNSGRLTITVDEENANRRRLTSVISFDTLPPHLGGTTVIDDRAEHWWLPVIPSGAASVDVAIRSLGSTSDIERIRFHGSGYHDHNWGILPFDKLFVNWTWLRADFGSGVAAVVYWTVETEGKQNCTLLLYSADGSVKVIDSAGVVVKKRRVGKFGTVFPTVFVVSAAEVSAEFSVVSKLEDVPFYIRYRHAAVLSVNGRKRSGTGTGEYFKPRMMQTAVVSSAMSRRIYSPVDGS